MRTMFLGLALAAAAGCGLPTSGLAAGLPPVVQATGPARPPADAEAAIQDLLQRYARAWYEGNAALMLGTLHPDHLHQTVVHTPNRLDRLEGSSGLAWLEQTDRGLGRATPPAQRKAEVAGLQVGQGIASAWLQLADRRERLQLVLWNNEWRVLHSASERSEKAPA
ncbi:nuclear transport factor 2 family protein [Aquabacterium sp.]|uniref:nuclear transport factor 2 family protein n=1 Tax=Aquabacterium sp. TaxID=1872578 RepID=UPI003784A0FA